MRPIAYVAPSLLVGALLGFVASQRFPTRIARSQAIKDAPSHGFFSSSNSSDAAVDYRQLARACVDAAEDAGRLQEQAPGTAQRPHLDEDQAKETLSRIEERAISAGVWSRIAGFKAQALLGRLPTEESRALAARLGEQLRSSGVRFQPGAWVPPAEAQ